MSWAERDRDRCRSCGKRWTDHNGVEPTCKELQEAREAIENLQERLKRELEYRAALHEFLEHELDIPVAYNEEGGHFVCL